MTTSLRRTAVAVLGASTVFLAGCGSSDTSAGQSSLGASVASQKKANAVAALLPAEVAKRGYITVATDASYPPMESFAADGKTIVGLDPDLGKALGQVLDIEFRFTNVSFDSIIPGLQAGKTDIGMSGINDTPQRRAKLDFVDYYTGGSQFFGTLSGPTISGLEDTCGHSVAVQKGTAQSEDLEAQSKKCTQSGKKAVTIQVYPDQTAANLALKSGRAEFSVADTPVALYQVKQSAGGFKAIGKEYGAVPHGIAVPKGSGLTKALTAALKQLMAGPTYKDLLAKYGLAANGLESPQVNGTPAP